MKAGFNRNLRQRKFSSPNEANRLLNALLEDVLMWRQAYSRTKLPREMKWTDSRLLCKYEDGYVLIQV
jgi:hypothetical protein